MTTNDSRQIKYAFTSSSTSSSVLPQEEVHFRKSFIIAPFLFTFMTMTAAPTNNASDISAVSQPVTICQTYDMAETMSNEEVFKNFVSKLILESKDIDPEIAEIVNRNYRDLLW
jgi:hypothetical protein